MGYEEEEACARGTEESAQQIGPNSVLAHRKQQGPDVGNQDEQRCSRRVRYAERLRRRNEFARVPESHGGSERQDVHEQDQAGYGQGGPIGRSGTHSALEVYRCQDSPPTALARLSASRAAATSCTRKSRAPRS